MEKGFEPGSEVYQNEGKLFIRVSNISEHGIIDKDQKLNPLQDKNILAQGCPALTKSNIAVKIHLTTEVGSL